MQSPVLDDGTGTSAFNERASVSSDLIIHNKAGNQIGSTITKSIDFIGPGDIIGLKSNAVIRVEPQPNNPDFEPSYLPYIEFYDEDLPWRYTPGKPSSSYNNGKRLRPWMYLLVLKEEEYALNLNPSGPLPIVSILGDAGDHTHADYALPKSPQSSLWPWAHVQVSDLVDENATDISDKRELSPDFVIARVMSARKLDVDSNYRAFLIPTFETGRQAGLDPTTDITAIDAMMPSWDQNPNQRDFPVYYHWAFGTSSGGTFETLAKKLVPQVLDASVGARDFDMRRAKEGFPAPQPDITTEVLGLAGALKTASTSPTDWDTGTVHTVGATNYDDEGLFKLRLKEYINKASDYTSPAYTDTDDPLVTVPLYGRWHAVVDNLNGSTPPWVNEVNLEPANRATAGIGTSVVIKNQEQYMDHAWEQVDEIEAANRKIIQAQLAKEASYAMYCKHVCFLPVNKLLSVSERMQKRVVFGTGASRKSAFAEVRDSNLPNAAQDRNFRKLSRPKGGITRTLNNNILDINPTYEPAVKTFQKDLMIDLDSSSKPEISASPERVENTLFALDATMTDLVNKVDADEAASTYTSPVQNGYAAAYDYNELDGSGNPTLVTANVFSDVKDYVEVAMAPKPELDLASTIATEFPGRLIDKLNPLETIAIRTNHQFQTVEPLDPRKLRPVLAAPHFRLPMYEHLRDLSPDFIFPNLDKVADNTIALLETNSPFIESYMVGLNHEMSRELLWREYPTDQRGTYFKQFWDVTDYADPTTGDSVESDESIEETRNDISAIHEWLVGSSLGDPDHKPVGNGAPTTGERVVLLLRGELFRKYPNVVIYAQKAGVRPGGSPTAPRALLEDDLDIEYPVFQACVEPDIFFLGFNLTTDQVRGSEDGVSGTDTDTGYYFVFRERPGQIQFGLDEPPPITITTWNDLNWADVCPSGCSVLDIDATTPPASITPTDNLARPVYWSKDANSTSADMAYILYQSPAMVAFHGSKMLEAI